MNGRLYTVSVDEMLAFLPHFTPEEQQAMRRFGELSSPIYVGIYNGQLLAILGLIPNSLISDEAYVWLYHTPWVRHHKIKFGRWAKWVMSNFTVRYQRLYGHCLTPDSRKWLVSLGARFTSPTTFEILPWLHH